MREREYANRRRSSVQSIDLFQTVIYYISQIHFTREIHHIHDEVYVLLRLTQYKHKEFLTIEVNMDRIHRSAIIHHEHPVIIGFIHLTTPYSIHPSYPLKT